MTDHPHGSPRITGRDLGRAGLVGAALAVAAGALFWATAAAQAPGAVYSAWIDQFGPQRGLARVCAGLLVSALAGALAATLLVIAWDTLRRRR